MRCRGNMNSKLGCSISKSWLKPLPTPTHICWAVRGKLWNTAPVIRKLPVHCIGRRSLLGWLSDILVNTEVIWLIGSQLVKANKLIRILLLAWFQVANYTCQPWSNVESVWRLQEPTGRAWIQPTGWIGLFPTAQTLHHTPPSVLHALTGRLSPAVSSLLPSASCKYTLPC